MAQKKKILKNTKEHKGLLMIKAYRMIRRFYRKPKQEENEQWIKKFFLDKNLCQAEIQIRKQQPADPNISRIASSLFIDICKGQIQQSQRKGKYFGELPIRTKWEQEMGLIEMQKRKDNKILPNNCNYIKEAYICSPKYPICCGILDGFVIDKNNNPIIIEFKGVLSNVKTMIAKVLSEETDYMAQMIMYSFILNWVDVWFVWGEQQKNGHIVIKSKLLKFSKIKPHKKELEEKIFNEYLQLWMLKSWSQNWTKKLLQDARQQQEKEQILIKQGSKKPLLEKTTKYPKPINFDSDEVKVQMKRFVQKDVEYSLLQIRKFLKQQWKQNKNIRFVYPKLKNLDVDKPLSQIRLVSKIDEQIIHKKVRFDQQKTRHSRNPLIIKMNHQNKLQHQKHLYQIFMVFLQISSFQRLLCPLIKLKFQWKILRQNMISFYSLRKF